ncbi:hypothetical protein [Rhizobium sp. Root491]|nr:hypothetical protein [Rhizobium sp. Root491]
MGFTPQQVNDMTAWQFMATVDGYVEVNTPDDGSLTAKEIDELWDWVQG